MMHSYDTHSSKWPSLILSLVIVSALIITICGSQSSDAQPGSSRMYIISGYVLGPKDEPIPNATIEVFNPDTGESFTKNSSAHDGNYTANLANLADGWEDDRDIIITVTNSVYTTVTIQPNQERDESGMDLNISLPALIIEAPVLSEKVKKEDGTYQIRLLVLPTLNVQGIKYSIDGVEIFNGTDLTHDLQLKDYDDGTHTLRVVMSVDSSGTPYSQEVFFNVESKDDDSGPNVLLYVLLAVIILIAVLVLVMLKRKKNDSGVD